MKLLHRSDVMPHLESVIHTKARKVYLSANSKEWHTTIHSAVLAETEYAILSHRWLNKGELSFADFMKLGEITAAGFEEARTQSSRRKLDSAAILGLAKDLSTPTLVNGSRNGSELLNTLSDFCSGLSTDEKPRFGGLIKVVEFCVFATQQRYKYVWMDTCCIDKSRSAELEESIRSMFRWYRNAKICIVHLADTRISFHEVRRDAWFTRGWTLQELLAPVNIKFVDADWCPLTKNPNDKVPDTDGIPLWKTISRATGIDVHSLLHFIPGMHNIRKTMVWASKRTTTRIEDVAYSLIGMLDVPLSIAYGEGQMAFYRLQVEIVQRSRDKGIFAWQGEPSPYNSMFATSPQSFSPADVRPLPFAKRNSQVDDLDRIHTITNYGMRMSLSLYQVNVVRDLEGGRGDGGEESEGASWVYHETARSGGPTPYALQATAADEPDIEMDSVEDGGEDGETDSEDGETDSEENSEEDSEKEPEECREITRSGEPTSYALQVTALGTIFVVSGDALSTYDRLAIAILANGKRKTGKSLALLLGYRARDDQYIRVATKKLIWVERLPQWKSTETIYIQ